MQKNNKLFQRLSVLGAGLLVFGACARTPSEKQINKKHEKYMANMPDTKLQAGKVSQNAEKLGNVIAWEMAADIDSLICGLVTPEQKYGLCDMYCNTAVTTALCDALKKTNFQELYHLDFFAKAKITDRQRGTNFIKYLQSNKEAYDAATKVINFAEITPEDYENMNPGTIIFYRGNYINPNNGKTKGPYSHTQMVAGKGFSDDVKGMDANGKNPGGTKFAPSSKGETITVNAYGNLFRYGADNIEIYENRQDVKLDKVIIVDMAKYLQIIMQNSK